MLVRIQPRAPIARIAQLIERNLGMVEVSGLIPLVGTISCSRRSAGDRHVDIVEVAGAAPAGSTIHAGGRHSRVGLISLRRVGSIPRASTMVP